MASQSEPTSPPRTPPRRLSDVLRDLESGLGPRIALGDLVSGLRDRSFAPLMVLFAVPNAFLYLPGSSVITGVPLMIIALQLIAGRRSVWLPRALSDRSIDRSSFARIVRYSLPWIERIERMARPRFWPGAAASIDRLIGLACLIMALLLFLPIPFANGVPALAIIAMGLAL
ncbi:MAG: exopolysaccharide biosynthesis protein, partial [Silicimonas sp.]|nr:exopolysaccharide biosynthesis protein [Silicimonas sp.]